MRNLGRAAICVLLLALCAAPARPEEKAGAKVADTGLKKRIDSAVRYGADRLLDWQEKSGRFDPLFVHHKLYPEGCTALAVLALLHSGVSRDTAPVQSGFGFLRERYRSRNRKPLHVYTASLVLMAFAELGREKRPDGTEWLEPEDGSLTGLLARKLAAAQRDNGGWSYGHGPRGGMDDLSNSQYALLGLNAARRLGIEVKPKVFADAMKYYLDRQQRRGRSRGWGYRDANGVTGSMTAAGLSSLEICRRELDPDEHADLLEREAESRRAGLAWLRNHFVAYENPPGNSTQHHYYLYGVERTGVLCGVDRFGRHLWYEKGARHLLGKQQPDGAFSPQLVDHCFALLFLTRATARSLGEATGPNVIDLTHSNRQRDAEFEKTFKAAFRELLWLDEAKAKARAGDFALCGPRVVPLLIRRLHDTDPTARRGAVLVLRTITGLSFDYDADAAPGVREQAVDGWTGWYLKNRHALTVDGEARRLRVL